MLLTEKKLRKIIHRQIVESNSSKENKTPNIKKIQSILKQNNFDSPENIMKTDLFKRIKEKYKYMPNILKNSKNINKMIFEEFKRIGFLNEKLFKAANKEFVENHLNDYPKLKKFLEQSKNLSENATDDFIARQRKESAKRISSPLSWYYEDTSTSTTVIETTAIFATELVVGPALDVIGIGIAVHDGLNDYNQIKIVDDYIAKNAEKLTPQEYKKLEGLKSDLTISMVVNIGITILLAGVVIYGMVTVGWASFIAGATMAAASKSISALKAVVKAFSSPKILKKLATPISKAISYFTASDEDEPKDEPKDKIYGGVGAGKGRKMRYAPEPRKGSL